MRKIKELLIIAGLPRSGTTWLESILNAHPRIFLHHEIDAPGSRRWNFSSINQDINPSTEPRYRETLLDGIERLKRSPILSSYGRRKASLVGFKTVGRFTHPRVFRWVRRTLDFPKTVYIVRHPAGYVASQLRFPGRQTAPAERIIASGRKYIQSLGGDTYPQMSLAQYHALFWKLSNEQILRDNINTPDFYFIVYEDLCKNPEEYMRRMLDFLELGMHRKLVEYLRRSTDPGRNMLTRLRSRRFYSTVKDPWESANKWRKELLPQQQSDIWSVVGDSPLMKYWKHSGGSVVNRKRD